MVQKRLESNTIRRKSNRLSTFDNSRNLAECEMPDPMSDSQKEVECRRMQLKKWKEEKERRKKEAAAQKKKPFIAGIVHLPLKYVPPPPPRPMRTKSQFTQHSKGSKSNKPLHSFAPSNASFKPPELKNVKKLPTLARVQSKRKKIDIMFDPVEPDVSQKKPSLNLDKSNSSSTKSESEEYPKSKNKSSEERLRSPKALNTEEQQIVEVQKISPCVTLSPSKKMEGGLLNDVISDMERVAYFRGQLDSEVKRITQMCETWDRISQQVLLSESALEMVLCAVGQARLLVSQKMTQFGSLVAACERPDPTTGLVTPTDLQGFWDVVRMQVENVDMRFKKLEELRARNWIEETPVIQKKRAPKTAKNKSKPAATSRLRDLIAAARKAKKNEDPPTVPSEEDPTNSTTKFFKAGFFCVGSPIRTPLARSTPSNQSSLLNTVLPSEIKRAASISKDSTSLAMLRASKIGRSLKKDDTALEAIEKSQGPLIQINLMATPGRSINSINVASTQKKLGKKSIKIVLFNNSDGENSFSQSPEAIEKVAEGNVDSGLSSMDVEKETDQNKENMKQTSKLVRQNALEDRSPVLTRSRRKSET
ncbi:unnamed protein product [Parnassius apollo]|uniref:(apollo) hypothetical protein n=1 Tax=Parnassius apollo TaxID=110799 RepID=A0A8S3WV82_PARAO|nr:unnamed protein product [Parnassius apollo]